MASNITNIPKPLSKSNFPRIALIGCGAISDTYYLPTLQRHPEIMQYLILVDHDEARLQEIAKKYHVTKTLTDYQKVPEDTHGIIVALPTHLHLAVTNTFLSRGIPVLCEKPLADSGVNAMQMIELANRKGIPLATNYLQRLIPSFAKVKEILSQKIIGEPIYIKYLVGEEFDWPTSSGFYFNSPLSARGVLRDRGAHAIDHICWWLGGKPNIVKSQNDAFGGSEAVVSVQFNYGKCSGDLKLSWLSSFPCIYQIICENGKIEGDVYDYQNIFIQFGSEKRRRINLAAKERTKLDIADKIISNFIDVIYHRSPPLISGSDVLNSLEFIDECYSKAIPFDMPWYKTYEVNHG